MPASMPENKAAQRPKRKRIKKSNPLPSFEFEQLGLAAGHRIVAGIDEAGRGPWAGPVVAAAVVLDPKRVPDGIADSKQLSENAREELFEEILKTASVGVAFADPERIDRDNILAATLWSMQQAVTELPEKPHLALIDGNRAPQLDCAVQTIVKGDARSLSIAAASIVAKVSRDRMMKRFDAQYPDYGFGQHKGYGTALHSSALKKFGVTPLHRRSFKPVREALDATAK
jgi:ribonuclease HII